MTTLEGFTTTVVTHMTPAQARQITMETLSLANVKGWTFVLDNAKRRAGQANFRLQTVSMSRYLLGSRSYEDSLNTITHEVAHALVGAGHGHDRVWAGAHRALGGDGKRCFTQEGIDEKAPWIAHCEHRENIAARYRAPKRLEGWQCKCAEGRSPVTWVKR